MLGEMMQVTFFLHPSHQAVFLFHPHHACFHTGHALRKRGETGTIIRRRYTKELCSSVWFGRVMGKVQGVRMVTRKSPGVGRWH